MGRRIRVENTVPEIYFYKIVYTSKKCVYFLKIENVYTSKKFPKIAETSKN